MRTYRLMLSPNYGVEISPEWIAKLRKGDLTPIYRAISSLTLGVLLAAAALFPLLTNWASAEFGYTTYLIVIVTFLVASLIAMLILVGTRRLSDPPLFMPALIFVFLVLAGLLFAPANSRNTFGAAGIKYLGGLWVMCLLGFYYLITVFVNTGRKLRWAKFALMVGLVVAAVMQLFASTGNSVLFPMVVIAVPVLGVFAVETRRSWISIISGIAAVVALIAGLKFAAGPQPFIAVFIAGVMTLLCLLAAENWQLKFDVAQLRSDFMTMIKRRRGLRTFVKNNLFVLLVGGGLVWLVITIAWMVLNHFAFGDLVQATLQSYVTAFQTLTSVKAIIIGNGVGTTVAGNLIANVIMNQGLVGIIAYVIMAVAGFYLALQRVAAEVAAKSLWSLPFIFIVFAAPILGLLANPGIVVIILWWAVLGLLAAKQIWDHHNLVLLEIRNQLTIRSFILDRFMPIIQVVLVLVVFGFWIYLMTIVAAMAVQGLI